VPLITGPITEHGAVIDVLVGVSNNRQAALERTGQPVPSRVSLRLQIDTGSYITGLTVSVFRQLDISPIGTEKVRTRQPGRDTRMRQVFTTSSSAWSRAWTLRLCRCG
jgi:hypothetical protein